MEIVSPFMECIGECRNKMKKLRKKIYKNLKAKTPSSPSQNMVNPQGVQKFIRDSRIPPCVLNAIKKQFKQEGLQDITNIFLAKKVEMGELKDYADQQERQVQEIMQNTRELVFSDSHDLFMSEEDNTTLNRMKSRSWLQSTQLEYEDQEIMERNSKITLRPFELFHAQQSSINQVADLGPMRETQGYLEIESGAYLEENIFPF